MSYHVKSLNTICLTLFVAAAGLLLMLMLAGEFLLKTGTPER